MPDLILNDGKITTGIGVLESEYPYPKMVESFIEHLKAGQKLDIELVDPSKHHKGPMIRITDGDGTIEMSPHGLFCWCWSGAS